MEIQYLGDSCFRIKGSKIIILTDPPSLSSGLKLPKISADIVTFSYPRADEGKLPYIEKTTRREPLYLTGPGEYEVEGVFFFGLATDLSNQKANLQIKNTAFIINLEGIRMAHLGSCGAKFNDEQLEEINGIDLLFIPVGGNGVLSSKAALEVISQIEPKIIIPMSYQQPGLVQKRSSVDEFLNGIGVEVKPVPKLIITKENLPEEKEVVVLENK